MRARHPGFSWALHVVGSLGVIALVLLSAAVISGSVIYVINDASEPSSETNHAAAGNRAQPLSTQRQPTAAAVDAQGKPVRVVDPAFPPPHTQTASGPSANTQAANPPAPVTATTPAPAATSTPAPTPPQAPAAASAIPAPSTAPAGVAQSQAATDVASHSNDAGADSSRAEQPAQKTAARAEEKTSDDKNNAGSARAASRYPANVKKRAAAANTARSTQASDQAQSTARRQVYDYYRSDDRDGQAAATDSGYPAQPSMPDPRAQRGSSRTKTRIIVRRQDDYYDQYDRGDDRYRAAWPAQPRPRQSFFGFFGRDRSDNWQDDRD